MIFLLKNKLLLILTLLVGFSAVSMTQVTANGLCELAYETGGTCLSPEKSDVNACHFYSTLMSSVGASITNVTPLRVPQGSTLDILISALNTQFDMSSIVQIDGITVNQTNTLSPTKIQANVTVPADATLDSHTIRVVTQGKTVENTCLLQVINAGTTPKILSISPTLVEPDFTGSAIIYGINTHFSSESQVDLGSGITATVEQAISPTQLKISLVVTTNANSLHDVSVTTGSEIVQGNRLLLVTAFSKLPTIMQIEPSAVQQGTTVTLSIQGRDTHFIADISQLNLGEDITIKNVQVQNETTLSATVEIAESASVGFRDVFVQTEMETATGLERFSVEPCTACGAEPTQAVIKLSAQEISAESAEGTVVGYFSTVPSGDYRYELTDNAGGRFQLDGDILQVADSQLLKGGQQATIQVQASRDGQETLSETFTISIQRVNHAPTAITLSNTTISIDDTEIGQLSTADVDENDSHQYTFVNNAEFYDAETGEAQALFKLVENSLQVAENDFLEAKIYPITVRATDKAGLSIEKSFEIVVTSEEELVEREEEVIAQPSEEPDIKEDVPELPAENPESPVQPQPEEEPDVPEESTPVEEASDKEPVIKDEPEPPVDAVATPSTNSESPEITVITIDECQPKSDLALSPAQKTVPLIVGDEPFSLEFSGGQGEVTLAQKPNSELVLVEFFDFPKLRLFPLNAGETEMTLQDCAGHEAVVNIIVNEPEDVVEPELPPEIEKPAPEPLQPEQQTLTLFVAEPPITLLFTGNCQAKIRQAPNPEMITVQESTFPATGGAQIILQARKVGEPTQLVIADNCGHTATVNLSVEAVDPCAERVSTSEELFLVEGEEPMTQWFAGELNNRHLIQPPNGDIVNLQAFNFHEAGGAQLTFAPRHAGQTVMQLKTGECSEVAVEITVFKPRTLAHLCWLDQRHDGICQTPDREQVLAPNALAIDRRGELIETETYFSPQHIDAEGHINMVVVVDEQQVNQQAHLLMVAVSEVGSIQRSLVYDGSAWQVWDGNLNDLIAIKSFTRLPHLLEIQETVPLEELWGSVTIYVGYQLDNGTIVFNGQNPLLFKGGNALRVSPQEALENSSARFEGLLDTFRGKQGVDLTVAPIEAVTLSMKMMVEKEHVGQAASLVLVLSHWIDEEEKFFTLNSDGNQQRWVLWDEDFESLRVAHRWTRLVETVQFQCPLSLETLPLETRDGEFTVYVGYRLGDGVIVFNGLEPLVFRFSE